jgi:hypothetical protein
MLVPATSYALTITQNDNAADLANNLFLNLPGLSNVSASFVSGDPLQSGTYTNVIGTYGLPQDGIVFSTGNVNDYNAGGNADTGTSTEFTFGEGGGGGEPVFTIDGEFVDPELVMFDEQFEEPFILDDNGNQIPVEIDFQGGFGSASENQNALLNPITGSDSHFDVVQLDIEFDTASNVSQVTFFGAFGSEEWPEFVGSFNDGFGLYVNGVNEAGVSEFNGGAPLPVNIDHPSMAAITGTELDGVLAPGSNPVLRFDVPVNPGTTNNFTIILADTNDAALDTTIYLSSFIAANPGGGGGTPVPATGATEFDPLLPIVNGNGDPVFDENGGFIVDISDDIATNGQTVWIDPPVAVGYTYQTNNGVLVTEITAPSLASVADIDGYMLKINGVDYTLAAGAVFDVTSVVAGGVDYFEVSGIDVSLSLDPSNPLAFPIGVKTDATAAFSFTITPIVVNTDPPTGVVPLPATGLLYIGAVLMGGGILRRRQKAA